VVVGGGLGDAVVVAVGGREGWVITEVGVVICVGEVVGDVGRVVGGVVVGEIGIVVGVPIGACEAIGSVNVVGIETRVTGTETEAGEINVLVTADMECEN